MNAKLYQIDAQLQGTIRVLHTSDTDAGLEAGDRIARVIEFAAGQGLYFREPGEIRARLVLGPGDKDE